MGFTSLPQTPESPRRRLKKLESVILPSLHSSLSFKRKTIKGETGWEQPYLRRVAVPNCTLAFDAKDGPELDIKHCLETLTTLHLSCQEHYQSQSNDKRPTLGCAIDSKGSPPQPKLSCYAFWRCLRTKQSKTCDSQYTPPVTSREFEWRTPKSWASIIAVINLGSDTMLDLGLLWASNLKSIGD